MGTGKITITDVADALGVSKTTVSRAISGKGRIGSETRERILAYIDEHEYVPNVVAKGLAQSKTYNIGITLPDDYVLTDLPFFKKCLMGVCEFAGMADYDVVVSMVSTNNISQLERIVNNHKVDGIILTRTLTKDIAAEFLKAKKIPFVTLGTSEDNDIVQIDNDHETACRELTSLLLMQKVGKIVLLGGDRRHVVTRKRYKGFEDAILKSGQKVTPDMVYYDVDGNSIDRIIDEVLSRRFECILCMDDSICERVLDKLKKERIHVPDAVRVASFYNSTVLEKNTPSITSLQFDAQELGRVAAKTLLNMIDGSGFQKKTLLGYEISIKNSTMRKDIF